MQRLRGHAVPASGNVLDGRSLPRQSVEKVRGKASLPSSYRERSATLRNREDRDLRSLSLGRLLRPIDIVAARPALVRHIATRIDDPDLLPRSSLGKQAEQ